MYASLLASPACLAWVQVRVQGWMRMRMRMRMWGRRSAARCGRRGYALPLQLLAFCLARALCRDSLSTTLPAIILFFSASVNLKQRAKPPCWGGLVWVGGRKGEFARRCGTRARSQRLDDCASLVPSLPAGPQAPVSTHLSKQATARVVPHGDDVALRVRAPILDDVGHVCSWVRGRRGCCSYCGRWRGSCGCRRRDEAHLLLRDGGHGPASRRRGRRGRVGARGGLSFAL